MSRRSGPLLLTPNQMHDVLDNQGRLVCNCPAFKKKRPGRLPLCVHIIEVIDQNRDGVTGLPSQVVVPIFKTPALEVVVTLSSNADGLLKVFLPLVDNNDDALRIEDEPALGFIGPGDGRKVIRTLILDFIYEVECGAHPIAEELASITCTSSLHFGPEKSAVRSLHLSLLQDRQYICNLLSLIQEGECWTCLENNVVPDVL